MNELEQLKSIDLKIEQLEQQQKALTHHLKQNVERRERTHLLIQTGALAEKYLPIKNMNFEEREEFFKNINIKE